MWSINSAGFSDYMSQGGILPAANRSPAMQPQIALEPLVGLGSSSESGVNPMFFNSSFGVSAPPAQDGGFASAISQFFNMLLMVLMANRFKNNNLNNMDLPFGGQNNGPGNLLTAEGQRGNLNAGNGAGVNKRPQGNGPDANADDAPEADPREQYILGEDSDSNAGILAILNYYKDALPKKNGRVNLKDLRKFAATSDGTVPEAVTKAAKALVDNDELYEFLCFASGNTEKEGFKLSVLDEEWDFELDDMESIAADDVWKTLSEKTVAAEINKMDGNEANGATLDDIRKIALGQTRNTKLSTAKVQAAALKFLQDDALTAKFDGSWGKLNDNQGRFSENGNLTTNKVAISVFAQYAADMGLTGKINRDKLKEIYNGGEDIPADVKTAAKLIDDRSDLYRLLCLKTNPGDGTNVPNNAAEGFELASLKATDWGELNLDQLGSSADPAATLKAVKTDLYKLSGTEKDVTLADLRKVAMGDPSVPQSLKDSSVRAAALMYIYDSGLRQAFIEKQGIEDGQKGTGKEDPHFVGGDGEIYDFMGEPDKYYNILSDKRIQFNSKFTEWKGGQVKDGFKPTVMSEAGIQLNGKKIEFKVGSDGPTVDGVKLELNTPKDLGHGCTATWDGTNLTVTSPEYRIVITKVPNENGDYLNHEVTTIRPYDDSVNPHGILGQTFDQNTEQKNTGNTTNSTYQGGSVIDGSYTDYDVTDLWATDFSYNVFDPNSNYDSDDGHGVGVWD